MTLLHADGFALGRLSAKWDSGSSATADRTSPRIPGGAHMVSASLLKTVTPLAEVYLAAAFWFPAATATVAMTVHADTGTVQHITVVCNASGKLEVRRGSSGGTVLATGATTITAATWVHIEARFKIADSGGVVQVRLNGNTANEINYTGDTKNGGSSTNIDHVRFYALSSATKVTDCLITSTSGTVNNSWMGDRTVITLVPDGNGAANEGTSMPNTATAHWSVLTELPYVNDGLRMVLTGTQTELFQLTDLPWYATPAKAAQINLIANRSDSTDDRQLHHAVRTGGNTYISSPVVVPYSAVVLASMLETNPDTGAAWTVSEINAVQVGARAASQALSSSFELRAVTLEVVIASLTALNVVDLNDGGSIDVDIPNDVYAPGGGTITIQVANLDAGLVPAGGGGSIDAGDVVLGTPRTPPAAPTFTTPATPVIERRSLVWPAPTLIDGVPQDWAPE